MPSWQGNVIHWNVAYYRFVSFVVCRTMKKMQRDAFTQPSSNQLLPFLSSAQSRISVIAWTSHCTRQRDIYRLENETCCSFRLASTLIANSIWVSWKCIFYSLYLLLSTLSVQILQLATYLFTKITANAFIFHKIARRLYYKIKLLLHPNAYCVIYLWKLFYSRAILRLHALHNVYGPCVFVIFWE